MGFCCGVMISGTMLSGCGETLLDGSSDEKLMESYKELRKDLSQSEAGAFDLAFHKTRDLVNAESSQSARDSLRESFFSGKGVAQFIADAKKRVEAQVVEVSKSMQESAECYKSYSQGLQFSQQRMKNSSVDPENRVEYSFDLFNGSNYPVAALQLDLTMEIFGAPDYERKFDGDNFVRCFGSASVPPGGRGKFTCNIRYKMGSIRFDGPVEDMQVFSMTPVNNDPNLQDGKEEAKSMASCRKEMEQHKGELKTLTSYMEQLMTYRR